MKTWFLYYFIKKWFHTILYHFKGEMSSLDKWGSSLLTAHGIAGPYCVDTRNDKISHRLCWNIAPRSNMRSLMFKVKKMTLFYWVLGHIHAVLSPGNVHIGGGGGVGVGVGDFIEMLYWSQSFTAICMDGPFDQWPPLPWGWGTKWPQISWQHF